MGNHPELKNAETYCSACDVTRRFVVPRNQALKNIEMSCRLCDRKLRMHTQTVVPRPDESGTYLIAQKVDAAKR